MQPFSIPKQAFSPSGALPHQTNVIHAHSSGFLISALVKSRAAIHVHSPARSAILSAVGLLRAPARDPPAVLMPLAEATRRVADATCFFSMFALLSLPRCGPPPFLTTVAALPPDSLVQNCSLAFQLLVASAVRTPLSPTTNPCVRAVCSPSLLQHQVKEMEPLRTDCSISVPPLPCFVVLLHFWSTQIKQQCLCPFPCPGSASGACKGSTGGVDAIG
eukprot:GGOE01059960.1.p1 GENE.GGOE01059960.1~~GGOE01059960.1.p1  ORF type:complete len:218 (-),score=6.51 GGOE01059960.1:26-679(-)